MKLTQSGASAAKTGPAETPLLAGRVEQLEQRLAQIEQAREAAPAFDQKVLEAVVSAVEARLREQQALVDQRLGELETKIAGELKTLQEQDHAVASFVRDNLEELQEQFAGQIAAVRREVAAMGGPDRDRELLDLLNGVGDLVRQAAARISETAAKPDPPAPAEMPVPTFASAARPRGLWRLPIVSCMAVTAGALAMMHFL